jgi:DNA-directed RNA polymerase specialized sigma24 family protein
MNAAVAEVFEMEVCVPPKQYSVEQLADALLWSWELFNRDSQWLGLPRRSVTEKANEGGIAAGSPRPPSEMPDAEALSDRAVAALGLRHNSVLRRVIYLRYEKHYPYEGIATAMHISGRQAKALLGRAQRAFYRHRQSL